MKQGALHQAPVLVVGAGLMGVGIAQVAALAGHAVFLFDARADAAAAAVARLAETFDTLVSKGKLGADAARAALARLAPVSTLDQAHAAALVIEAIVEDLPAKRALLQELEARVGAQCILASNTSSISITALAQGLKLPHRLVGMHFFNPVPLMRLVEVVSGLHTDAAVAEAVFALAAAWGKTPVHARSTPGFIVNRIARPYYAEALALLLERAVSAQVIDACHRAAGFRMGPCELMDLIGHDTNLAVTQSVYDAYFQDPRYRPSPVQRELVDAGWLGRKSGRGFYHYSAPHQGAPKLPEATHETPDTAPDISVLGEGPIADHLELAAATLLAPHGRAPTRERSAAWIGLRVGAARLVLTQGPSATELARTWGVDDVVVFDRPMLWPPEPAAILAWAAPESASAAWREQAAAWLAALGFTPMPVADTPALVVARTVAMLINEAADAVQQGVCSAAGADAAMKLGVNYPAGPFEWLAAWSPEGVMQVLDALDAHYRGERYRVSPGLRRHAGATRTAPDAD